MMRPRWTQLPHFTFMRDALSPELPGSLAKTSPHSHSRAAGPRTRLEPSSGAEWPLRSPGQQGSEVAGFPPPVGTPLSPRSWPLCVPETPSLLSSSCLGRSPHLECPGFAGECPGLRWHLGHLGLALPAPAASVCLAAAAPAAAVTSARSDPLCQGGPFRDILKSQRVWAPALGSWVLAGHCSSQSWADGPCLLGIAGQNWTSLPRDLPGCLVHHPKSRWASCPLSYLLFGSLA